MAIDKLIPRYLNLDDDERLVQSVQMTDNLNVDISVDESNDAGVIKQAKGNRIAVASHSSEDVPSGVNHVISAINFDTDGLVFYFLWNSNNNHGIYMYDVKEHKYVKLLESTSLAFEKDTHIQSDVVKTGKGDVLLYFTDNINEPRKINVTRLLSSSYDASIEAAQTISNAITVCKRPPMIPPTFAFAQTGEHETVVNRIIDNVFQFACQYVYVDGEVSAIGPYSKLAFYNDHFNPTGTMSDLYLSEFDSINVSQKKSQTATPSGSISDGDVKSIRFLARAGNTGAWVVFDEILTSYSSGEEGATFTNSKAYRLVGDAETNKLFDSVPYKANSLCISENRLFFGNYVDGRDATTWPEDSKAADLTTHSFPVEAGIEEVEVSLDGNEIEVSVGNEDVDHSYLSLSSHKTQYPDFVYMEPRVPNNGTLNQDSELSDANSGLGYFVKERLATDNPDRIEGDSSAVPWAIKSSGLTSEASPSESNMAWGMGNTNRIEVKVDLSEIPSDGFGVSGQLQFNWFVEGRRAMLIPNYSDQNGKREFERKFKPFPGGTEESADSGTKSEIFKLFHGGESIGGGFDLSDNVLDLFKNCGIAGVNGNFNENQSVTIDVQASMNRGQIADAIASKINESNVAFRVTGSGYATAHGNPYTKFLGILNRLNDQKMCRYLLKNNNNSADQFFEFKANNAFVVESEITIQYRCSEVNLEFNRVGHAGPARKIESANLGESQQPEGLDTMTPLENGNIELNMLAEEAGIDGNDVGNTAEFDLFHSAILGWMPDTKRYSIFFETSVSDAGDLGVNRLTFRSGAHHPLGVVFYDHRNRSSNVNLLPESYVPFSGNPDSPVGNGSSTLVPYDIDVNFATSYVPSWAERFQIVYAGNSLFEESLTVTVAEALTADMSKVIIRDPSFSDGDDVNASSLDEGTTDADNLGNFPSTSVAESIGIINNAIYLPMRFFEGKVDSYKESKSSLLNYEYRQGDKVRIVSYGGSDGSTISTQFPKNYFFEVLGYKFFNHNDEQNVLVLPNQKDGNFTAEGEYRRSGWMLILKGEDVDYPGFRPSDIRNTNATVNNWGSDVRIEILRPKIDVVDEDRVYFEIGESFLVSDDSKEDVQYDLQFPVVFNNNNSFTCRSRQRLFKGDRITPIKLATEADIESGGFFGFNNPPNVGGDPLNADDASDSNVYEVSRVMGRFYDQDQDFEFYEYEVFEETEYSGPGSQTELSTTGDQFQIHTQVFGANADGFEASSRAATCTFSKNSVYRNVHLTNQGDTFFRQRDLRASAVVNGSYDPSELTNNTNANFVRRNIEDPGFNDFLPETVTRNYHYGRAHIYSPEPQTSARSSSVTYSDPYASDGEILSFSSFNPSMFPFKDYNLRYGSIQRMFDMGGGITMIHERKTSATPVSKDYLATAEGGMMIASSKVLGTERYYAGDYGVGKFSKGAVEERGVVFFADVEMGVVCMLTNNGIKIISDSKASSHFKNQFELIQAADSFGAVLMGTHPDNNELIVAINSRARRSIAVGGVTFGRKLTVDSDDNDKFDLTMMQKVYKIPGSQLDIVNDNQSWNSAILKWEQSGKGVVYVDQPRGIGFVDGELEPKSAHDFIVTNKQNDFFAKMSQSGNTKLGTLDESSGGSEKSGSSTASKNTVAALQRGSIGYSIPQGVWITKYSFEPEDIVNVFEHFLTFVAGKPYLHDDIATVNNYYGVQYNSQLTVVSKLNPSMVKLYKALSLEGNSVWAASITNREQSTTITTEMWKDQDIDGNIRNGDGFREGMLYCDMPGDTSNTSHLDEIAVGVVASSGVDGANNRVTFTSRVDNIPFNIGDTLFDAADGATTSNTIEGVHDRFTLKVSGVSGLADGDNLIARNAADTGHVTGDSMRDYFLKIALTNSSTTKDELYAVNAIFERSRLHNDKVN